MGGSVFPPCCLTWCQTMVEVMKIMSSFFKSFCAHTVSLSTPNLAPGYHWSMLPMETPGHSWVSVGQSLVGHCSFLLPILHKFIENIYSLELWIRPGPCLQAIWSIQISFSSKFMYKTFIRPDTLSPTETSNTSSNFHVFVSCVHFSEAFTHMCHHPPEEFVTEDHARSSHAEVLPGLLSFL